MRCNELSTSLVALATGSSSPETNSPFYASIDCLSTEIGQHAFERPQCFVAGDPGLESSAPKTRRASRISNEQTIEHHGLAMQFVSTRVSIRTPVITGDSMQRIGSRPTLSRKGSRPSIQGDSRLREIVVKLRDGRNESQHAVRCPRRGSVSGCDSGRRHADRVTIIDTDCWVKLALDDDTGKL